MLTRKKVTQITPSSPMPVNPQGHAWDAAGQFCLLCGVPMDDRRLGEPCDQQIAAHWIAYGWVA